MSTEIKAQPKTLIGFLAHEYGHLFSEFNVVYTNEDPNSSTEEGMADVFAVFLRLIFTKKCAKIKVGKMRKI